eukprot:2620386-Pyramimonas_sp.AAC.1
MPLRQARPPRMPTTSTPALATCPGSTETLPRSETPATRPATASASRGPSARMSAAATIEA